MRSKPLSSRSFLLGLTMMGAVLAACGSDAGPTVRIGGDGVWSADPQSFPVSGDSFRMTVENQGSQQEEYVVVVLWGGSGDGLPVDDGVLDVSRDGVTFDATAPETATFSVVYSKEGILGEGGAGFEPAVIGPGETQTVTIGSPRLGGGGPGRYVVLSHLPGAYESGSFAEFTATTPDGAVPTMTQPAPPPSWRLEVGYVVPDWVGSTLEGDTFSSSQLDGRQALILVLSDGHDLAGDALGTFATLAEDFDDDIGFVVIDSFSTDRTRLQDLVNEAGVISPVVLDEEGVLGETFRAETEGLYWIFTDGSHRVTATETGIPMEGELASLFDQEQGGNG